MADSHQVTFTKAAMDELITFVDGIERDINDRFLRARGDLMLDGTLGTFVKPGSRDWPPVQAVTERANTFGGSVHDKFTALSTDWHTYRKKLVDTKDVFEKTDDLATMEASKFSEQYPDLGPGPGSTG